MRVSLACFEDYKVLLSSAVALGACVGAAVSDRPASDTRSLLVAGWP